MKRKSKKQFKKSLNKNLDKNKKIFDSNIDDIEEEKAMLAENGDITINEIQNMLNTTEEIIVNHYVSNDELKKEMIMTAKTKVVSDNLANMFVKITTGIASRFNFKNYTYLDDMISQAFVHLISYAKNYDSDKNSSAFCYCSQVVFNAFLQTIKEYKKHVLIKDCVEKSSDYLQNHHYNKENNSTIESIHRNAYERFSKIKKYEYL